MRGIFNQITRLVLQFLGLIRGVLKTIVKYIYWVFDQLLGTIPNLIRANKIIEKKVHKIQEEGILSSDPRLKLTEDELVKVFETDLKRLERIEEKARNTVIGVALSVSLTSPGLILFVQTDILASETFAFRAAIAVIFVLAILFLSVSGYLSLSCYKVSQIMRPRLEDSKTLSTPRNACKVLLLCSDCNVLRILQKSNLLSASMDCLRNGLLLLLIFIVLSVVSALI